MRLIIVRHGETDWTLAGRYTGVTEVLLIANGRRQATLLPSLLLHVLHGQSPLLVSSPRQRATETAALTLPERHLTIEPLVAEYDYGDYEGLTTEQIRQLAPGWDMWRDGCPHDRPEAPDGGHLPAHADPVCRPHVRTTPRGLINATIATYQRPRPGAGH